MYCCKVGVNGLPPEPYHIPGYKGHVPSLRNRFGATFSRLTRDSIEDPCVSQSPQPILQPPMRNCDPCIPRPAYGCVDPSCCNIRTSSCCDPKSLPLNRSPYACPCPRNAADMKIYRNCEALPINYAGHVPGFDDYAMSKTFGRATWGIGQYMSNCWYKNNYL